MIDASIRKESGWSELQLQFNRCCNCLMLSETKPRLSEWEKKFIRDLQSRCGSNGLLPKLSEKQVEIVQRIAEEKCSDVIGL